MNGQLAYKDVHGRVWNLRMGHNNEASGWHGETLDKGHTEHAAMHRWQFMDLIESIDREPVLLEKAQEPLAREEIDGQPQGEPNEDGNDLLRRE